MRKNKYRGAGFFTRNTNSKPVSGPRLQPKVGSSDSERGSASRGQASRAGRSTVPLWGTRGPLRKTVKRNNNVVKSSTGPFRKTVKRNNNTPKSTSGPLRKTVKRNNNAIVLPREVRNIPLNVSLNNNNIKNNIISQVSTIESVSATADNTITLQHLWNEVYGNGRYDELFDYVLAGKSIDFSTVPKDLGWIQDLNVYLIGPSTTKIKTLMNFAPTRSLLSKSLSSLGINKDFINVLMNRYKQLSNDDKLKFIEHVKKYAEQYASTTSTLRIE